MPDIIDTADIANEQFESGERDEDSELTTSAVASHEEKPGGISFHVQMRDWTVNDMEELIVEAAARIIVGRHGDTKIAKQIEERALALITQRADAKLSAVADNVLGTTLTPKGFDQKAPVTIGEMIGMLGREYLEQVVDRDGNPVKGYYDKGRKRIEHIVTRAMDQKFKAEIQYAMSVVINELRAEFRARHEQILAAEKARIAEALAKL